MPRALETALEWSRTGAALVTEKLEGLEDRAFDQATGLPGWTRKHIVAHLAANGTAIGNLVHWAATGQQTPMYSSPEQRTADIEAGAQRPAADLCAWFAQTATDLDTAMAALPSHAWRTEIVTAQGRWIPVSETPWMRSREVMVHAVDLDVGVRFSDLPVGFLVALVDDVSFKRGAPADGLALELELVATDVPVRWTIPTAGPAAHVRAPLATLAAYLTGRAHHLADAPELPPWL